MTDSDEGRTGPFADLASTMGVNGGVVDPRLTDPELHMHYPEVQRFADHVGGHGRTMSETSAAIKRIDMPMGTFGVVGGGLNGVHDKLRDQAAEAVAKGKEVFDSWHEALYKAMNNLREADRQKPGGNPKMPGGPGVPKTPAFGAGDPGLGGGMKLPAGAGVGGPHPGLGAAGGLEQPDPPGPGDLPGAGGNGVDLPGAGGPAGGGIPGIGRNGLDGTGLDGTGLGRNGPDLSGLDTPRTAAPGDTALSAHTPNVPPAPAVPGFDTTGHGAGDPGSGIRPGTGAYGSAGYGTGGHGTGGPLGQGGAGRAGAVMGGVPPVPYAPMGGAPGGDDGRDRERGPAVPEDESTWFGDEDVAPAVLGMQEED